MTSKQTRVVAKLAILLVIFAATGICVFYSRIWRPLLVNYDSKPHELFVVENDPNAIDLPLDHEVVKRVSGDVDFLYNLYLVLENEDLETIESRWDRFQSGEVVDRILAYYSKEVAIGDGLYAITIKMLDRDRFKHLAEVSSRIFSFDTIRDGREYSIARCGFRTYGCGSGTLTWRGAVYDGKTLTHVHAYFSEGRMLFCEVTTDSREICIVYNEKGAPKRVLQVQI